MAKPPKSVKPTTSPDISPDIRPLPDTLPGNRLNVGIDDPLVRGITHPIDTSTLTLYANDPPEPSVIVTRITDPVVTDLNTRLREISWPGLQTHLLRPHDSIDGFHVSPNGDLYAHLEEGGYYRAELNTNGDYQIPWPDAPGITPPILKKIKDQPRWRPEADWYSRQPAPDSSTTVTITIVPTPIQALEPHLAATLSRPELSPDAIRYNKLKHSFVDTAEGTVMVRKSAAGQYYQASATGPDSPDTLFERIPETQLWRLKPKDVAIATEPAPSGSRRPSSDPEESGPATRKRSRRDEDPTTLEPDVAALPGADWRSWGNTLKPQSGDAIEIDGQHYAIVAQPTYANDALVFIKNPDFTAVGFDAFEQILLTAPEMQPRGAIKVQNAATNEWKVVDGLLFRKTISQYVFDAFPYLADDSVSHIASALFNQANHLGELNGNGLNDLYRAINYWADRPWNAAAAPINRQKLADPLTLLTPLAKDASGFMYMPLPSAEGLHRIDIASQRIPREWSRAMSGSSSRAIFKVVLEQQGYAVSSSFRQRQRDALMFKQTGVDALFVMLFGPFENGRIYIGKSNDWILSKALRNQIEPADALTLREHLAKDKIIYLLGSFNILPSGQGSLVITKFV